MRNDDFNAMVFEGLEERRMMSGTVLDPSPPPPVGWPLVVNGSSGNDVIKVAQVGLYIVVTQNGYSSSYPSDQTTTVSIYGNDGSDLIDASGMGRKVYVEGGASKDTIIGGLRNDTIYGGVPPVNGIYYGADVADDSIDGGAGNDTIYGSHWGLSTVNGGAGNDTIYTSSYSDVVDGGPDNDLISAGDGYNKVLGGPGDDTITTGTGNDSVWGGLGNDQIAVNYGNDLVYGEGGNDSINGGARNDVIDGGWGNDTVNGGPGPSGADTDTDLVVGGDGIDTVSYESRFSNVLITLNGAWINGQWTYDNAGQKQYTEKDYVGSDFENAIGGWGNDMIAGNAQANVLNGNAGNDTIYGSAGNDTLDGDWGDDEVHGEDGNDAVDGSSGDDALYGEAGVDVITGDVGKDRLYGGRDNDTLDGGLQDDVLVTLGGGVDTAIGGATNFGDSGDFFWAGPEDWVNTNAWVQGTGNVHVIPFFVNGAPTELDGQDLPDPAIGNVDCIPDCNPFYSSNTQFTSIPLFRKEGPTRDDIVQQRLGDCYFLAPLAGIAAAQPDVIRRSVTDLGDGTYAVRFFDSGVERFLRVDAQLPVQLVDGKLSLTFAGAARGTLWAPIMEKAWAWFRTSDHSYEKIEGSVFNRGTPWETYDAFNLYHDTDTVAFNSKTSYMTKMRDWLATGGIVSASTNPFETGVASKHVYTVVSVSADLTSVTLRNPWRKDDDGFVTGDANDGYITISVDQFDHDFAFISYAKV